MAKIINLEGELVKKFRMDSCEAYELSVSVGSKVNGVRYAFDRVICFKGTNIVWVEEYKTASSFRFNSLSKISQNKIYKLIMNAKF